MNWIATDYELLLDQVKARFDSAIADINRNTEVTLASLADSRVAVGEPSRQRVFSRATPSVFDGYLADRWTVTVDVIFNDLDESTLTHVIEFLKPRGRWNLAATCRKLRKVVLNSMHSSQVHVSHNIAFCTVERRWPLLRLRLVSYAKEHCVVRVDGLGFCRLDPSKLHCEPTKFRRRYLFCFDDDIDDLGVHFGLRLAWDPCHKKVDNTSGVRAVTTLSECEICTKHHIPLPVSADVIKWHTLWKIRQGDQYTQTTEGTLCFIVVFFEE